MIVSDFLSTRPMQGEVCLLIASKILKETIKSQSELVKKRLFTLGWQL
jgi:hypothetical protein